MVSPEDARDSSHDPYYLQFRARLLLAKARLQWLGTDDSRFRDADYYVESARASVSTDDHAQLARLEMTWAEGLLLQASLCLKNDRADRAAPEQALAAARVHYRRAGDALQRAHEHLSRSSRDVERWAWYHRTWAQCQAEWSLFHLADLENQLRRLGIDKKYGDERRLAGLTPHDMAALLKRLDRGLNGLQAALVIQRDGNRDPGLWRIWLELLCAGMVYGVTTVASTSFYEDLLPETSWPLGVESFWKHWISLNMRAGIPNTVELHGKYCSYLKADVRDAGAETGDWRKGMVDGLCGRTLRDAALAVADELYELTQQGCSPAQFATTLTRRITEIAHPAPCVMPDT